MPMLMTPIDIFCQPEAHWFFKQEILSFHSSQIWVTKAMLLYSDVSKKSPFTALWTEESIVQYSIHTWTISLFLLTNLCVATFHSYCSIFSWRAPSYKRSNIWKCYARRDWRKTHASSYKPILRICDQFKKRQKRWICKTVQGTADLTGTNHCPYTTNTILKHFFFSFNYRCSVQVNNSLGTLPKYPKTRTKIDMETLLPASRSLNLFFQ